MDELITKNVLLQGRRKIQQQQYSELILNDSYPSVTRHVNEVLISQYASALCELGQTIGDERTERRMKYPAPILFALQRVNESAGNNTGTLQLFQHNFDRKQADNHQIINYNIAKLYNQAGDYPKCVFFLETVLRENPFFADAVYDYCSVLHSQFSRTEEALAILTRHLRGALKDKHCIQTLYIALACKKYLNRTSFMQPETSLRDIFKLFHSRTMTLLNYYNLALLAKKGCHYQRATDLFNTLLRQLTAVTQEAHDVVKVLDGKLLLFVKLHLAEIYERHTGQDVSDHVNNAACSNPHNYANKKKALQLYKELEKVGQCEELSMRVSRLSKILDDVVLLEQPRLTRKLTGRAMEDEKENNTQQSNRFSASKTELLKGDFEIRRKQNDKKLRYLLHKEKKINHFFVNVTLKGKKPCPTSRADSRLAWTHKVVKNGDIRDDYSRKYQSSRTNRGYKMRLGREEEDMLVFEKQFQEKRKAQAFKYNQADLEELLHLILNSKPTKAGERKSGAGQTRQGKLGTGKLQTRNSQSRKSGATLQLQIMPHCSAVTEQSDRQQHVTKSKRKSGLKQMRSIENLLQETPYEKDPEGSGVSRFQRQLKEVSQLQNEQRLKQAYDKYTRMYKQFKEEEEKQQILFRIAKLYEREEKYLEAEKTYVKCCKINSAKAFMHLGELLLRTGRIKSGVDNLEKANCLKRFDLQIESKLVYGYSLRNETMDKALMLAHTILKKEPESLSTLLVTANILQKQGKVKEALQIAIAIDHFKQTEYIKHYIGLLQLEDSNVAEAFRYFREALVIKPDYGPSLIEVATIISDAKPKQAIAIFHKLLELQPDNKLALTRLGKIYEDVEHDYDSAMEIYRTALKYNQNFEALVKIGDCYEKKQMYSQALNSFKDALQLRNTHQVQAKIARMHEFKKQPQKALIHYEAALALVSTDSIDAASRKSYLQSKGQLQIKLGDFDRGIAALEYILEQEESVLLYKLMAQAYFGKGEYGMAIELYEKARSQCPNDDTDILLQIAQCFDRTEEYLASKAVYERVLVIQPDNVKCMNNLANVLLILGETNQAFYLLESMLAKLPNDIDKRIKVADIYATVGDWSKVEYHLLLCYRQKQYDQRVLERLTNLYKEKRDPKLLAKYEKKLALLKLNLRGKASKD